MNDEAHSTRQALRVLLWALAAGLLWMLSGALELRTDVEIRGDDAGVSFTVAGTTIESPRAVTPVHTMQITAVDSISPPGGVSISMENRSRPVFSDALPRRFDFNPGRVVPLGDWFIDRRAGGGTVYGRTVDPADDFVVRAAFTGRSLSYTTISLRGNTTVHFRFRRGLINNDLTIAGHGGQVLVNGELAPRPWQRLLAALATLLLAASTGCALIALFRLLAVLTPSACSRLAQRTLPRGVLVGSAMVLAVIAAALSVWLAADVLEKLPHVPDSVAYLLEARWLLDGRVSQPVSQLQEHFNIPFTFTHEGRWLIQYPVGWPLLLAGGVAIGKQWLVAPLLGGLYLLLLVLVGKELYSPGVGIAAGVLAVISPMSTLIFASQMAHAASSTLILLFLWAFLVARRRGSPLLAAVAGMSLGYAFGIRPLTAVAVAIPFVIILLNELRPREDRRDWIVWAAAFVAGGVVGATPTMIGNALVTGSPFTFPYSLIWGGVYSLANLPAGLRNLDALLIHSVPALFGWGWPQVTGRIALALPLAFAGVPFLLRRQRWADRLMALLVIEVAIAHLGTEWNGLHGYGPRYYFEVFFCLYLLTARGFFELAALSEKTQSARPRLAAVIGAALLFLGLNLHSAACVGDRFELYRRYNNVDGTLEEAVSEQAVERGVIIFGSWRWYGWARAARMMRVRDDAGLIFAKSLDDNSMLLERYADRPAYLWSNQRLTALDREPE